MKLLIFGKITEKNSLPSFPTHAVVTLQPNEDAIIRNIKLQYHHPMLILPTGFSPFHFIHLHGKACCYLEYEHFFSKLQKHFEIIFCNDIQTITPRALSYIKTYRPAYMIYPSKHIENEYYTFYDTQIIGVATHYVHTL